jgi:LmbE family N-acetylglucosaminyl deacetylase
MRRYLLLLTAFLAIAPCVWGQISPVQPNSAEIKQKIKKLNFLGSVLYMAAHPDDENTRIITSLAKGRLATTGYLSLTRGDGGQNLVGPELRDELGVIRTQELLAARRIDGGEQYFTRANDFGFSKSAAETFSIWGKENILSDVLKVFREYQPDVIITRFPPDERAGHGHHTASAILAQEAFDITYNEAGATWKPTRVYTNTGRWWNKDINENTAGVITLDVGKYDALLGKSYAEISALSSSQHKSQGWGSMGNRGYQPEFLELAKGEAAQKDIFDGVNTTWTRVQGGDKIQPILTQLIAQYNEDTPSESINLLFKLRSALHALPSSVWKERKLRETNQLIQDCAGLYVEATSDAYHANPGDTVKISFEMINRSGYAISLEAIASNNLRWDTTASLSLESNIKKQISTSALLRADAQYSEPYWLSAPHPAGIFSVQDAAMIGRPENKPPVTCTFTFRIGGEQLQIERPVIYKWVDPVKGELNRKVEIVPPVFVNLSERVLVFNNSNAKSVNVVMKFAGDDKQKGILKLKLPAGWRATPEFSEFEFDKRGQELSRMFTVTPPQSESTGTVTAVAEIGGKLYSDAVQYIDYDHIPVQTLLPEASIKVVRLDLKKTGNLVGYVKGAGDAIPTALRNMGYQVWEMTNEEITLENLKKCDAVVLGIRAVNTNSRIRYFMSDLLEYANGGGTVVMQYNTSHDLEAETFSPYELKLSRDRVTQEDAEVRFLKPDHIVLNSPNKITTSDFNGWVQERGLYFPNQWDPKFDAVLSMNDPGEKPRDGSLLVAKYGSGYFVYTGLSFFRELPEGVPGAYKLFANLVSLGNETAAQEVKPKSKNKAR